MQLQVSKAHCRVPASGGSAKRKTREREGEVVADLDAIVCDFRLLGEGLVKTVKLNRENTV